MLPVLVDYFVQCICPNFAQHKDAPIFMFFFYPFFYFCHCFYNYICSCELLCLCFQCLFMTLRDVFWVNLFITLGFTYPVRAHFLEDFLEMAGYCLLPSLLSTLHCIFQLYSSLSFNVRETWQGFFNLFSFSENIFISYSFNFKLMLQAFFFFV